MAFRLYALIGALFALLAVASPAAAQTPLPAATTMASACTALTARDFATVQDAPTQIMSATWAAAGGGAPAHCIVTGYVSPQIGIDLRLPEQWNGKFVHIGCGGFCGGTFGLAGCAGVLDRGYACISSDMGHRSTALDGKWAYNNLQAKFDFGVRSTHVATLAGKAITAALYGKAPALSYYMGCSTGGRQGMYEAQHFPKDFNGIIAGAPVIDETGDGLVLLWNALATRKPGGMPLFSGDDIKRLHGAVIAACDMNDGVKDGLIGDGRACRFDPAVLACTAAGQSAAGQAGGCFDAAQVAAVRRIYRGPVDSKGETVFAAAALPGSELNWINNYVGAADGKPSVYYNFVGDLFRYMSFTPDPGPNWKPEDFDWDSDPERRNAVEMLYNARNPDLRRFKAAGGKLLVYHGWADQSVLPQLSVDYYDVTTRTMGGLAETQDFFRLFFVPGMNHCTGGEGAYRVDYLTALENWVERKQAPDVLVGQHPADTAPRSIAQYGVALLPADQVAFSRPHFPYPATPRYKGGDATKVESFVSQMPKSAAR